MGCRNAKEDAHGMNIEDQWQKRNLPIIDKSLFENESEITLFKTINLIRHDPEWAIPYIRKLR